MHKQKIRIGFMSEYLKDKRVSHLKRSSKRIVEYMKYVQNQHLQCVSR